MKKVGIYFLGLRRLDLLKCHLPQLAKCKNRDFHFYLMSNQADQSHIDLLNTYLPNQSSVVSGFDPNNDYLNKVVFAINQPHKYSVKMDEDCILLGESWDRFLSLMDQMTDSDLFCTGAISNGVPGCDFFIKNFIPHARNDLGDMFAKTKFIRMGTANYTLLNQEYPNGWDSDKFYEEVWKINHYYMGIHPVRYNFDAAYRLNDYILADPIKNMTPINAEIIRDVNKYPYFCNSFFGIRTEDWRTIVSRMDLFVDPFEEVPINRYRHETNRNMVMDTGIPILHTMYNWSMNWEYENTLIGKLIDVYSR